MDGGAGADGDAAGGALLISEQSAYGTVVVARMRVPHWGMSVACKTVDVSRACDGGAQKMGQVEREVEALARRLPRHPHIAALYGVQRVGPVARLYLELGGADLLEHIRPSDGGAPTWRRRYAAAFLAQLADALAHLHAARVAHRDLKPENVLFDAATGRALLIDFGLVHCGAPEGVPQRVALEGSKAYIAPEVWARVPLVIYAADMWSLGAVAHVALKGRPPLHCARRGDDSEGGDAFDRVRDAQAAGTPPLDALALVFAAPASAGDWAWPEEAALLNALLAVEPSRRPTAAGARALADALLDAPARELTPADARTAARAEALARVLRCSLRGLRP